MRVACRRDPCLALGANGCVARACFTKASAQIAMESIAYPEHIDTDERREGVIAYIDRIDPDGHEPVIEDVEFDDDRIHGPPTA